MQAWRIFRNKRMTTVNNQSTRKEHSRRFHGWDKLPHWPAGVLRSDKNHNWSLMMSLNFRWTLNVFNSHTASLQILIDASIGILDRSCGARAQIKYCLRRPTPKLLRQQKIMTIAHRVARVQVETKVIKSFDQKYRFMKANWLFKNWSGSIRRYDRSGPERTFRAGTNNPPDQTGSARRNERSSSERTIRRTELSHTSSHTHSVGLSEAVQSQRL